MSNVLKFKKWRDQYHSADSDTFEIIKASHGQIPIGFSEDRLTNFQSFCANNGISLEILPEDMENGNVEVQ